jgi:tetratricopeptide (TPR) repeat protein
VRSRWLPSRAPTLSAEGVDKELTLYLKYGGYKVRHVAFAWEPQPILAERELSEPEVHAVRALLFLDHPGAGSQEERIAKAKVELAPAIAAEPLLPAVLAVQTRFEKPAELLERARQSTQKFPSDARAWSVLAQVLGSDVATRSERIEAYAKANALDPDDAFRLNTYAWALVESGRYAEAVAPARRSVQLAPSSSNLDTLGAALAGSGQCAEALVMEQRAVEAIRPEAPARHQQAIAKNLMQIKEHCQPRP